MKKYFSYIFIILFVIIFSFFFWKDYFLFHQNNIEIENINLDSSECISDFSLEDLKYLSGSEVYYTPYKELKDKIIEKINNAKDKIYVEVYIFTEKNIRQAIINAKKRWLDVKIILEKNPYNAYNINNGTYDLFEKNWVNVVWSNPENYSLNHSKIMLIDDEVIISTWNFSHSLFNNNRDLLLFIKDKIIYKSLFDIFNSDFRGEKINIYNDNLALSPFYSRYKLEKLIDSSNNSIKMYFPYLSDKGFLEKILDKARSWIDISLILDSSVEDSDKNDIGILKNSWVDIKFIKTPKIHTKIIIVDLKYAYLWSINFSTYSFDENREVWIIFKNEDLIEKILWIYNKDFESWYY